MTAIIANISQKGGTGKTTIGVQFAISLAHQGHKVCILDVDKIQYSTSKWLTHRNNSGVLPKIDFFPESPETVKSKVAQIANQYDIIFIESSGKITDELKTAISLADMIIMPMQPTGMDLDTIPDVEDAIEQFIKEGIRLDQVPAFIIPNRVMAQQKEEINFSNQNNQLVRMHSLQPSLKFFKITKNFFKERPSIYPECYNLGKAVFELQGKEINPSNPIEAEKSIKKASEEFYKSFNEIFYGK